MDKTGGKDSNVETGGVLPWLCERFAPLDFSERVFCTELDPVDCDPFFKTKNTPGSVKGKKIFPLGSVP